jgi:hypothetical protein
MPMKKENLHFGIVQMAAETQTFWKCQLIQSTIQILAVMKHLSIDTI